MARQKIAIAGGVVGFHHTPGAYLMTDGKSLHPLQRQGSVPHFGFNPGGAAFIPGLGHGPAVGVTDLGYPATLTPGVGLNAHVRV